MRTSDQTQQGGKREEPGNERGRRDDTESLKQCSFKICLFHEGDFNVVE